MRVCVWAADTVVIDLHERLLAVHTEHCDQGVQNDLSLRGEIEVAPG